MTDRVTVGNLRVAQVLYDFVNDEALPGTGLDPDTFWSGVDKVVADLTPKNQDLLARRDDLQAHIDKWHRQRVIEPIDPEAYKQFLTDIGYLQPEPGDFTITTAGRRRRNHHDSGSAAGRPDPQRAIRAQRGERPVGLAVRRAVRHRRHPRGRRRREGHRAITKCAATRSSPTRRVSSTAPCRWPPARGTTRPASRSPDGPAADHVG